MQICCEIYVWRVKTRKYYYILLPPHTIKTSATVTMKEIRQPHQHQPPPPTPPTPINVIVVIVVKHQREKLITRANHSDKILCSLFFIFQNAKKEEQKNLSNLVHQVAYIKSHTQACTQLNQSTATKQTLVATKSFSILLLKFSHSFSFCIQRNLMISNFILNWWCELYGKLRDQARTNKLSLWTREIIQHSMKYELKSFTIKVMYARFVR